ncbi:hypothetical protein T06_96, partial [Trichinella sp. T6]
LTQGPAQTDRMIGHLPGWIERSVPRGVGGSHAAYSGSAGRLSHAVKLTLSSIASRPEGPS